MENHDNSGIIKTTIPSSPHVVVFPLPIQGAINCMLKLCDLILSLTEPNTIFITFLTTGFIHRRLAHHRLPAQFRFETVPDGLEPDDEESLRVYQLAKLTNFFEDQALEEGSKLREVLAYGSVEPELKKVVSCIIADGFFGFMVDLAKDLKVPLVYFDTMSPCGLWTYLCVPKMVQAGDLPFQDNDLDAAVTSVPGMETYLRRRDLPSFCRTYDPNTPINKLILKKAHNFPKAQAHILNTFDELEGNYFLHMRALCPNLYTIGPLHSILKTTIKQKTTNLFSYNQWQDDKTCLSWLDNQPPKSVLFVSMGSLAVMTKDQLMELWYGLVNSKVLFLWVRRPDDVMMASHYDEIPMEVLEGTKERGFIVNWAPQEEVLGHESIGGFFTHCGSNSAIESIVEGVPMICWPFFVDQQVNSRVVTEVWKIGLDMKDTCDRVVIEKMIKEVMGSREKFSARVDYLSMLANQAVNEDGSSYNSLNRLIDDIRFMRFPIP